jgi:Polyketide cyclase / dehydrase and lipid transport
VRQSGHIPIYRQQAFIEAPIEVVWELIADVDNHPDWWPKFIAVEDLLIRCIDTGTYVHMALTDARGGTFVDGEAGMEARRRAQGPRRHRRQALFPCLDGGNAPSPRPGRARACREQRQAAARRP